MNREATDISIKKKSKLIHFNTKEQAQTHLREKGYDLDYYRVIYREVPYTGWYLFSWKLLEFLSYRSL